MKKALLQKPIKDILLEHGFEQIKNEEYAINAHDNKTKLILKIPNGKNGNGFVLGAQFSDFGQFDGSIANATMRQFDHTYDLAYGTTYEYTTEQIRETVFRILEDYKVYFREGASAIKERIDTWTFGDFSDLNKDAVLRYLGLSGIDPYSSEYQSEVADRMSDGGAMSISLSEYVDHKAFYDGYQKFHAKISVDEKHEQVTIHFYGQRKWYQQ
ncbi:MAG: hypothetical protein E7651_03315 [Ruminococcaceae bacterium]|nr:hypothetical protein [Oscillospiraceae bacterium]